MIERNAFRRLAAACLTALALAGCGAPQQGAASAAKAATVDPDGFDRSQLDINRPCTLLSHADAERVNNQPFFRTIVADRVEADRVRCAHGVGAGGIHAIVEADFLTPPPNQSAELYYVSLCRAEAIDGPQPEPSAVLDTAAPSTQTGQALTGRTCRLANGSYAMLMSDRVAIAVVRGGAGEVDPMASRRLAVVLSRRIALRN